MSTFISIYSTKKNSTSTLWISTYPAWFDGDPNITGADKKWIKTFENFLNSIEPTQVTNTDGTSFTRTVDKLSTLTNYISLNVYEFITDCTTYEQSIGIF